MNQILVVKDDNSKKNIIKKKKFVFKAQFLFSSLLIILLITIFLYFRYNKQTASDNYASHLSNNYQVYRLYSNDKQSTSQTNTESEANIIGNIQIPKLNISYPILSNLNENLLKLSPCRFFGNISDNSNLCIAGHNYDNNSFFSKIQNLKINDRIIISDNTNSVYTFYVFDNYEVAPSDLSPIYETTNQFKKELTLVTCNNQNDKRIIVKAKLDDS